MEGGSDNPQREDGAQSEEEITMTEYLQEQEKLEKDANVVLGGSDPSNCTYSQGYISRQALYACMTCTNQATEPAGICLACSLECHDSHELVELYTKRNFRCDCGNDRLKDTKCKLSPDKAKDNPENRYNHNFRGTYCICDRPYPDPEDEIEDEMIQCIVCEDWYHGRHLGSRVPDNDNYDEMICDGCMKKYDFLWYYTVQCEDNVSVVKQEVKDSKPVDVKKCSPEKKWYRLSTIWERIAGLVTWWQEDKTADSSNAEPSAEGSVKSENESENPPPQVPKTEPVVKTEDSSTTSAEGASSDPCLFHDLKTREAGDQSGATFWLTGWRSKLCTCAKCKEMYANNKLEFLVDESDPVHVYEAKAPPQEGSQYDQGMEALGRLGRVEQIEALHQYNEMKEELTDYLRKFVENGKVVREEDIREFYTQMAARKRQKTSATGIQYTCK